jgi:hypothetical protein
VSTASAPVIVEGEVGILQPGAHRAITDDDTPRERVQ